MEHGRDTDPAERDLARDAHINEAARTETLRRDAQRELGENLEQAAELISAAFELRGAFSSARR